MSGFLEQTVGDLRVRIEKVPDAAQVSEPQFARLPLPPNLPERPKVLRFGSSFRPADQKVKNDQSA